MHIANLSSLLVLVASVLPVQSEITFEYKEKSAALENGLILLAPDNVKDAFYSTFGEESKAEENPLKYLNFDQATASELGNIHSSLLAELNVEQLTSILNVAKRMPLNKASSQAVAPILLETMEVLSEAPADKVSPAIRNVILRAGVWEKCNPFTIITAPGFRIKRETIFKVFQISTEVVSKSLATPSSDKSVGSIAEKGRKVLEEMTRLLIALLDKVIAISTTAYELYHNIRSFIPPRLLDAFPRFRVFLDTFDAHVQSGVNIRALSIFARDILESTLSSSKKTPALATASKATAAKRPMTAADFDSLEAEQKEDDAEPSNLPESPKPQAPRTRRPRNQLREEEEDQEEEQEDVSPFTFDDRQRRPSARPLRRRISVSSYKVIPEFEDEEEGQSGEDSYFDDAVSASVTRHGDEDDEPIEVDDEFVSLYANRNSRRRVEYPKERETRRYNSTLRTRKTKDSDDEWNSNSSSVSFSF